MTKHKTFRFFLVTFSICLATLLLTVFGSAKAATTRNAKSASYNDVNCAVNGGPSNGSGCTSAVAFCCTESDGSTFTGPAADGDTVIVPAGTASWTSTFTLTKGITLIGATTTDVVNKTANDQTIILDNVPRQPGLLIGLNSTPGQTMRVSGFTFRGVTGTVPANNWSMQIYGTGQAVRVDNCHFDGLYASAQVQVNGWVYGVMDHCLFDNLVGSNQSINVWHDKYGGSQHGHGAWADSTSFGTNKFWFIEDCCMNNTTTSEVGLTLDGLRGGRYVLRHCHLYNFEVQSHGTEENYYRGLRAAEVYNNDFHWTATHFVGQGRSGVWLMHDNTWDGSVLGNGFALQAYRNLGKAVACPYLGAGSTTSANNWDLLDTEGNGTNVPTHTAFIYANGVHNGANGATTLTDTTQNWMPHQFCSVSDGMSLKAG